MRKRKEISKEDQIEWDYWNNQRLLRVYQFFFLQKDALPPRNPNYRGDSIFKTTKTLNIEERSEWIHEIDTLTCHPDFLNFYTSLKTDSEVGAEFRALSANQAVYAEATKGVLFRHWDKCKFKANKLLIRPKQRQRPKQYDAELLNKIAKEDASENKPYPDFRKRAHKEVGCSESHIRNTYSKAEYDDMCKKARITEKRYNKLYLPCKSIE